MSTTPTRGARDPGTGDVWDRWLAAALLAVLVYSVGLVVAGRTVGRLLDALGFGMRDAGIVAGTPAEQHVLLVYAVLGSVIIGWMVTLLLVARGPLRRRERGAWTTVAVAVTTWFVVDTTFSLAVGSPSHALFNVAFLAVLTPPIVAMRGQLRGRDRERTAP